MRELKEHECVGELHSLSSYRGISTEQEALYLSSHTEIHCRDNYILYCKTLPFTSESQQSIDIEACVGV